MRTIPRMDALLSKLRGRNNGGGGIDYAILLDHNAQLIQQYTIQAL